MNQDQFAARRREEWEELSRILAEMQRKGPRQMPLAAIQRVGKLYRQSASDLAYARTYFPGSRIAVYLNQLVGQAHSMIYAEEPRRLRALIAFFRTEVPQTIRGAWRPLLLSIALMMVGGLIGFFGLLQDPNLTEALIPETILQHVVTPEERFDVGLADRPIFGTIIMLNNIRVGVLAFALGVTLGIGTALILFYNGIILGAVAAQSVLNNTVYTFWAFILAHGALELMAIFLCGAAGFVMGWPIVAPGELSRKEAAVVGAQRAIRLVLGSAPFFIVAAIIEGWVTPAVGLSPEGKYAVGIGTGLAGLAYWLYSGRVTADPAP